MKLNHWVGLLVIIAGLDACRGNYIGAEECNASDRVSPTAGKAGGCPACECEVCPVCRQSDGGESGQTSNGDGAAGQPAEGGAGGSVAGVSGSGGAAGSGVDPDPCATINAIRATLPTPSFHLSFFGCNDELMLVDATLGRPPGSFTGTMSGAVACADGPIGEALDLSGGEVRFDSIDMHPVDLEQDTTMMAWIFQETAVTDQTAAFGRWMTHDQFGLHVKDGSVWTFEAVYSPDPLDVDPANDIHYQVSTVIDVGVWTHLAVVLRRGGEMRMYKNGVYVPQGTLENPEKVMLPRAFSFQMTNRPLLVGHYHDAGWDPRFDGLLDELRLYKTALTDKEVEALAILSCL